MIIYIYPFYYLYRLFYLFFNFLALIYIFYSIALFLLQGLIACTDNYVFGAVARAQPIRSESVWPKITISEMK